MAICRFRNWASATMTPHSQLRFTVQMVRGSEFDFAEFSHKAYNGRVLLEYFFQVLRALENCLSHDPIFVITLGAVSHVADYMNKLEEFPIYLPPGQAQHLQDLGMKVISCYHAAAHLCREQNLMLYPLRPKLHASCHVSF